MQPWHTQLPPESPSKTLISSDWNQAFPRRLLPPTAELAGMEGAAEPQPGTASVTPCAPGTAAGGSLAGAGKDLVPHLVCWGFKVPALGQGWAGPATLCLVENRMPA